MTIEKTYTHTYEKSFSKTKDCTERVKSRGARVKQTTMTHNKLKIRGKRERESSTTKRAEDGRKDDGTKKTMKA